MTTLKKVTMNLTERDIENTEKVQEKLHTRNRAEAVSAALTIVSSLSEMINDNEKLVIVSKDGTTQRLVIPGLTQ